MATATSWKHPRTGIVYPIRNETEGGGFRTSPALLKALKTGGYSLLAGSEYLYNAVSKRLVSRSVYLTRAGQMRPRFVREGWVVDPETPTVIERRRLVDLAALHKQRGTAANPKYYEKAAPYHRPAVTEQDRISRNLAAKIREMKDKGRIEMDGTPSQIRDQLKDLPRAHVQYVTKDGQYRCGGFLRKVEDDWFALAQPGKPSWSVQFDQVQALYAQAYKPKVPAVVPTTKAKTRFPVKIGDVIIDYARDNHARNSVMSTVRYRLMSEAHAKQSGATD